MLLQLIDYLNLKKEDGIEEGNLLTIPGMLLKSQIPIRTFTDWNENKPGFVEIDLVAHDCSYARGDYALAS